MIDTNKLYEIFADKIISLTNKDNWLLLFPYLSFTRANSIEIVFSSNTYDWSCGHIENPVLVKLINQDLMKQVHMMYAVHLLQLMTT